MAGERASALVASRAFGDSLWQQDTRVKLAQKSEALAHLLRECDLTPSGGTPLFCWVRTGQARSVYQHLLERQVLVRVFDGTPGLRFGLPGGAHEWER